MSMSTTSRQTQQHFEDEAIPAPAVVAAPVVLFPDYEVDPSRITRAIMSNVRGVGTLPMRLGRHA